MNQRLEKPMTSNNETPALEVTMKQCVAEQLSNLAEEESRVQLGKLVDECIADPKMFVTHVILLTQQLEAQNYNLREGFAQLLTVTKLLNELMKKEQPNEGS